MASATDIELIPMEVPIGQGYQIYIKKIIWSGIQELLEQELDKLFSVFGCVFRIVVRPSPEESEEWYAYVTFFSTRAAKSVVEQKGKLILDGQPLKINYSQSSKLRKYELSLGKMQELLTYYFGFNCWTSEIVFMERELEPAEPNTVQYLCFVRVKMPKEGLCSEGLGLSSVPCNLDSPVSRGSAFSCSQKFAMHAALKSAFSKFIIIVLANGKVTVEVDTTKQDPLIYDPAWDNPVIKVKDIFYDPEDEDECDDLDDMTEEQLEEILNQPI
ncbi:RAD52 motif-containing protein 1-like [Palaemon carinicauda]|uniref:RAD52 motif-containing protein 1-like n=1 Tax=Palaemon carinicauda TaxID=392227 RepID=UPI0035B5FC39